MKEQIINKASELFINYGFKTVTTSDLAKELGISKKTLYEYYPSKEAVIEAVIEAFQSYSECVCKWEDSQNVIKEMFEKIQDLTNLLKLNNSRPIWELKKYYSTIAQDLQERRKKQILKYSRDFILKGIEQGFFKTDIDVDFMAYFNLGLHKMEFDADVFPEGMYSFPFIVRKNMELFIRLLSNEKGLRELEQIKNNYIRQ